MRRRVFLVDDSPLMRELFGELIEMQEDLALAGTAASAEEALGVLPELPCDLALIDVSMPEMNGLELAERLRRELPALPTLLFSAHTGETYARRAREAGARGYVEKGNPAALLAAIRGALRGDAIPGEALDA
jgi:two-component system uhpT operon response regulator UhpA